MHVYTLLLMLLFPQVDSQLMAAQGGAPSYDEILSQYPVTDQGHRHHSSSSYGHGKHGHGGMGGGYHSNQQSSLGGGAYGQRGRVGTEQLVELLQRQHGVFLQVAARVAETHEYCDRF